jgi:hypothetical protein
VVTYFKALKIHYSKPNLLERPSADETVKMYSTLDARTFKTMICNRSIEGANKNITLNQNCDRIDIGYAIYDMDPESGELEVQEDCQTLM